MGLGSLICVACAPDSDSTAMGVVDQGAPAATRSRPVEPTSSPEASEPGSTQPGSTHAASVPAIVILGDSLTTGYGIAANQSFPAHIQARIDEGGLDYRVVNAGVSGDTTAGGRRRLNWVLDGQSVAVLVVALGGNDGLRGLPVAEMKANLESIIESAHERDIEVVLAGMEAPPNHGPRYTDAFRAVFAELAREQRVAFFPFLLTGVAGEASLNQADGIHPNPDGARAVAEHLWPYLEPFLADK